MSAAKWDDLLVRMISGAAMAVVGLFCIWLGGVWFLLLTALVCGLISWELARMIAPDAPQVAVQLGGVTALGIVAAYLGPALMVFPFLLAPAVVGLTLLKRHRLLFAPFIVLILFAGYQLLALRSGYGVTWLFWLVLVVIATDVFGYFAGRFIGGPKFWPRISPKKTWSGTVAGWIAAAVIGAIFYIYTPAGYDLIWISVLLSMASQAGDMAESAIKRKMGVKDSSNLIPGHGGLFDRFDGLLGASVFLLIVIPLVDIPQTGF